MNAAFVRVPPSGNGPVALSKASRTLPASSLRVSIRAVAPLASITVAGRTVSERAPPSASRWKT